MFHIARRTTHWNLWERAVNEVGFAEHSLRENLGNATYHRRTDISRIASSLVIDRLLETSFLYNVCQLHVSDLS